MASALPPPLRAALDAALAIPTPQLQHHQAPPMQYPGLRVTMSPRVDPAQGEALRAIFAAVDWPSKVIPVASMLTEAQREVAAAVADRGFDLRKLAIPRLPARRRRWLGLDPPTALERPPRVAIAGAPPDAPLWRVLLLAQRGELPGDARAIRDAALAALTPSERLPVLAELALGAYGLDDTTIAEGLTVGPEAATWAADYAADLVALWEDPSLSIELGAAAPPVAARWLATVAFARAGTTIAAAHQSLLFLVPRPEAALAASCAAVAALPADRRVDAVLESIRERFADERVGLLLALLPVVPSVRLVDACFDTFADEELTLPRQPLYEQLRQAVAGDVVLAATVASRLAALPVAPRLSCAELVAPTHASQLTPLQAQQVATCARGIQGCGSDWINDEEIGYLELFGVFDERGVRRYDAAVLMGEDGMVFAAGTTQVAAVLCQHRLSCHDVGLADGLAAAMASRPHR